MYSIFRDLAIIILSAKFFGLAARKCKAPQVVGEILAGLLIGPCLLNLVQINDTISVFAEIGVVLLMFSTGLGTNLKELMRGRAYCHADCLHRCACTVGRRHAALQRILRLFGNRQPGILPRIVYRHDYDRNQRVHHSGNAAGVGPLKELPWHYHCQRCRH